MKKIIPFVVTISLLLSGVLVAVGNEVTDGSIGEEIEENKLQSAQEIHDWYDLNAIRENLSADYVLMNDLDGETEGYEELASENANELYDRGKWKENTTYETNDLIEYDGENYYCKEDHESPSDFDWKYRIDYWRQTGKEGGDTLGWDPIGEWTDKLFNGSFEGNGFEVKELYLNRTQRSRVGLFGIIDNGSEITNLGVVDAKISGSSSVGTLVGENRGTVKESHANGEVNGGWRGTGGLIGNNLEGMIMNSYATGNVTGDLHVGGLAGFNEGTIKHSYADGDMTGRARVGGLVGTNEGTIETSYASSKSTGENWGVGGLVGANEGIVENSYASGEMKGNEGIGGLVGSNRDGSIFRSYADGEVSGQDDIGGLVGNNPSIVENSFYHEDMPECGVEGFGSLALSDKEFGSISSFKSAGWDIEMIDTDRNRPFLSWEEGDPNTTWYIKETEQTYDLTIEMEGEGDTDPSKGTHTYYEYGKIVIEAVSAEGWYFLEWTGDYAESKEEITVSMDSDYQVTVHFEKVSLEIYDWYDLDEIKYHLNGEYTLMRNLDEDTEGYDELVDTEKGWEPIGNYERPFTGEFDGNDNKISGLFSRRPTRDTGFYVGLFGNVNGGSITNITLQNVSIIGNRFVGGLAGNLVEGVIENSQVEGEIIGEDDFRTWVGGLIGRIKKSTVENSNAIGNISGDRNTGGLIGGSRLSEIIDSNASVDICGDIEIGGLIGYNIGSNVSRSYSTGSVDGKRRVGGLIGWNGRRTAKISYCYATGDVAGSKKIGGLIGENQGNVTDSYATGEVKGETRVGGLIGQSGDIDKVWIGDEIFVGEYPGHIESSYSIGNVTGENESSTGGLVGYTKVGDCLESFWDVNSSGQKESDGGTGLNTEEMVGSEAEENMEGFDFEEVWETVEENEDNVKEDGYPILKVLDREDQLKGQDVYAEGENVYVEEDDEVPGFVSVVLLLAGVITVVIYSKKKE